MRTLGADGLDLLAVDCRDVDAWRGRIERDRLRAQALQTPELRAATELAAARVIAGGADAVALTGSTARGRRTAESDLDLHIVGARPALDDVGVELDVYATTAEVLTQRLHAGDDYVQWTLRFGCVLFDRGVLRLAACETVAMGLWPSPERKLDQARRMLDLAALVVDSGDHDAAGEQTRSALTAVARWRLLRAGVFPLSRDELPGQLRGLDQSELASALNRCIHGQPSMQELAAAWSSRGASRSAKQVLGGGRSSARRPGRRPSVT